MQPNYQAAAWETPFAAAIDKLRNEETSLLLRTVYVKSLNISFFFGMTVLCTAAALLTFTATGGILTATKVFTVSSLFAGIRLVAGLMLPAWIQTAHELGVTIDRIQRILELESGGPFQSSPIKPPPSKALGNRPSAVPVPRSCGRVGAEGGSGAGSEVGSGTAAGAVGLQISQLKSSWSSPEGKKIRVLNGIDLTLRYGELAMVLGPVGAGKTTLLLTLLGELTPESGLITRHDGDDDAPMIYAPQQPWVFPGTVRDNILFGRSYVAGWYAKTVQACQLVADLLQLESGDGTMIGERGVTLSGGQKARVSLARTVYAAGTVGRPCIVLLDDPFSAVDARVGQLLFEQVVQQLLAPHACLVVTHHAHLAKQATTVLAIDSEGHQLGSAAAATLVSAARPAPTEVDAVAGPPSAVDAGHEVAADVCGRGGNDRAASAIGSGDSDTRGAEVSAASAASTAARSAWQSTRQSKAVIVAEHREEGGVSLRTVTAYFTAADSHVLLIATAVLLFGVQGIDVGINWYLATWSQEAKELQQSADFQSERTRTYGLLIGSYLVLLLVRTLCYMHLAVQASKALHAKAFAGVMRVALRFFDTQPVGRILNRFAKDVGYVTTAMRALRIEHAMRVSSPLCVYQTHAHLAYQTRHACINSIMRVSIHHQGFRQHF
jgi:ATP-binding cassette subfamily C (CFTR/MRP) protein 4